MGNHLRTRRNKTRAVRIDFASCHVGTRAFVYISWFRLPVWEVFFLTLSQVRRRNRFYKSHVCYYVLSLQFAKIVYWDKEKIREKKKPLGPEVSARILRTSLVVNNGGERTDTCRFSGILAG